MSQRKLSSWFVFTLITTSFALCGLKIHIGTAGTILGYQLASLKGKESSLYHQRNLVEAKLSKVQNADYLQRVIQQKSLSVPTSLVMHK
jgi:hypothetical protein